MRMKSLCIIVLVAVITVLHYTTAGGHPAVHLLHRELYFIPILLAGFWFGLRVSLITSFGITLVYLPPVLAGKMIHDTPYTVLAQLVMFNVVALIVGLLEDRRAREQEQVLVAEKMALLGRAASAIGLEVRDVAESLRNLVRGGDSSGAPGACLDMVGEIDRLDRLLLALMRFVPPRELSPVSLDMKDLAASSVERLREAARKAGVRLVVEAEATSCRTRAVSGDFGGVIDALVKNAVEASPPGGTVTLALRRDGQMCLMTVRDDGPGILPEDMPRIFMPFFSTKPGGHGLTLAATKKYLKDIGGEMTVESTPGKGAAFHMHIPRERAGDEPLDGFGA